MSALIELIAPSRIYPIPTDVPVTVPADEFQAVAAEPKAGAFFENLA
jgi:hypothetical protein